LSVSFIKNLQKQAGSKNGKFYQKLTKAGRAMGVRRNAQQ
jgi:hypothetical protein